MHDFILVSFVQFGIICEVIDFFKNYLSTFFLAKLLFCLVNSRFLSHLIVVVWILIKRWLISSIVGRWSYYLCDLSLLRNYVLCWRNRGFV